MKHYGTLLLIFNSLGLVSCGQHEEVGYYPTGEMQYRAPLDDEGVFDGVVTNYYKNGQVQSVKPFRNHHINGVVKRYTSAGRLESIQLYKNGKPDGLAKDFYPNGKVKFIGYMRGNVWTDTARWYYPNGQLRRLGVYDNRGRQVDFRLWRPDGRKDLRQVAPLLLREADTVRYGQDYEFEVVLGNRRSDHTRVQVLLPAVGVDSTRGRYARTRYILRRPALGPHKLRFKVYEHWKRGDTLWTNWYGQEAAFYVKQ